MPINHCHVPKVYNTVLNGIIGPSFIDPVSPKEFPIIFDSGASVAISGF